MKEHARVVVIGGGAMGVSLLYHLAKRGWSDIVLVEKNELTAGSTWHAAGLCTHFAHNPTIQELRARSIRLYRDILPAETGLATGFHACGALRVTRSSERMNEFRHVQRLGRFTGHDFHILSPNELKAIYPLCETDGLLGAIHEPYDGHVDPTLAVNAMAAAARAMGAQIYRHNEVLSIARAGDEWIVSTKNGDIGAEHVVNAAGTWCREIGAMMGVDLPVVPMLHQYVVMDTIPDVAQRIASGAPELPIIRDPEESWYVRQERDGLIVGPYEKAAPTWAVDGVPPEFGMELLPPALDRIEHIMLMAMDRIPALASGGIKTVVNGPITFTPDANPLIGPAYDLRNAWVLTGSSMGVMEGGGAGAFLADWIVDGAPPMDAWAVDSRRFGGYADRNYRIAKAVECFGLQFAIHFPFEEREAGRPGKTTPLYEIQKQAGAVFGSVYGWERPNWFSAGNRQAESRLTFQRPGWFDCVAGECLAVRDGVGWADLSAFSKFEIAGRGASAFVETLGANRAPGKGRVGLTHVLSPAGGVIAEFAVTPLGEERIYLTSAAFAERHDEDLLRQRAADHPNVEIVNLTRQRGVIALSGPNARDVLSALTDADLSNTAFPWLSAREIAVAGVRVTALRVSYVGELGWELHLPFERMQELHAALLAAGGHFGLRPYGAFAMNSMRLEKGFRAMGDLTSERTPIEAGLGFLVKPDGRSFIGREAMLARHGGDGVWRMALLELDAEGEIEPFGGHPVMERGRAVGIVTSAAYGHRVGRSLALAYLRPEFAGGDITVGVLGQDVPARIAPQIPYDPVNARLKA